MSYLFQMILSMQLKAGNDSTSTVYIYMSQFTMITLHVQLVHIHVISFNFLHATNGRFCFTMKIE